MRRRAAFITATLLVLGGVFVACGLSVQGSGDISPTNDAAGGNSPPDGLPDGSIVLSDGAILLPDGDVIAPPDAGKDSSAPVIDAGPRPDASTQPPTDCDSNSCSGGTTCFVERCTNQHWATKVGTITNVGGSGGDCISSAGGYMQQAVTAPAGDNYRYMLTVFARTVPAGAMTIAEIVVGGSVVASIITENNIAKICRPASATLPALCVGNVDIGGGSWLGFYGKLSRKQPYGSANLSRTNACQYNAQLDLDIPPSGDVTARFGCISGANCSFRWYDARIELTPLP
jgi:hypothetical protein